MRCRRARSTADTACSCTTTASKPPWRCGDRVPPSAWMPTCCSPGTSGAAVTALPGGEIVPAMDRGLLDAAEFNNASSDRILGFADVSKVCMLQSYHQNAEQFEITFNKTKYDALPAKMKALIEYAVEAASADMSWKAIDRYSQDYIELQTKDKVRFYKTPDSVLQKQLDVFDQVMEKKRAENPFFKEITDSQRKFAERAVKWQLDTQVGARMAYNHYFVKKKG